MNLRFDVVVIGGGAAGLFCAMEAGKRRLKVLVLERNAQVGRKIIISGGGRCNFTNIHTSPENFVSTVYRKLGIDPGKIYQTPQGRPVHLVSNAEPILELMG